MYWELAGPAGTNDPGGPTGAPFADRVLEVVESIPEGRVLAYGDIAELLGEGGPRQVAKVMAHGALGLPWHRVVRADGSAAPAVADEQVPRLRAEGTPFRPGSDRVDMRRARWDPSVP